MTTAPPPVDAWSAKAYNTNASFVYSSAATSPVLTLLSPTPNERILDLGCGTGELTLQLAAAVGAGGQVVGVDSSAKLLAKARELEGENVGEGKVEWVLRDGHELAEMEGERGFAAVFSNAALHWMKEDPEKVVRGVHGVLGSGGRFVGEMGGYLNMVGVRSALHSVLKARGHDATALDPWYFPTATSYRTILEKAGLRVESCELVPRITPLPTGLAGWLATFGFAFLDHLSAEEKKEVIEEVCEMLEVDLKHEGGWEVMYVRLRFKAFKA